ncbi:hypothetical protein [Saccharopolyspora sp. CA-218241]|uniref:hypothetical protein n=1 Tax=Saccharopolyspora sp. CA-218241 TaxID=3240027 RepID=UPI003D9904A3
MRCADQVPESVEAAVLRAVVEWFVTAPVEETQLLVNAHGDATAGSRVRVR